jgi:hypothetical protein
VESHAKHLDGDKKHKIKERRNLPLQVGSLLCVTGQKQRDGDSSIQFVQWSYTGIASLSDLTL